MKLYGVDDELPEDLADETLEVNIPVGPPEDEDTATVGDDEAEE